MIALLCLFALGTWLGLRRGRMDLWALATILAACLAVVSAQHLAAMSSHQELR